MELHMTPLQTATSSYILTFDQPPEIEDYANAISTVQVACREHYVLIQRAIVFEKYLEESWVTCQHCFFFWAPELTLQPTQRISPSQCPRHSHEWPDTARSVLAELVLAALLCKLCCRRRQLQRSPWDICSTPWLGRFLCIPHLSQTRVESIHWISKLERLRD